MLALKMLKYGGKSLRRKVLTDTRWKQNLRHYYIHTSSSRSEQFNRAVHQ
jgi:hypothetical protein